MYRIPGDVDAVDELTHHEAILEYEPALREIEGILVRVPLRWARRKTAPAPPSVDDTLTLHWSEPACVATSPESCGPPDAFWVQLSEEESFGATGFLMEKFVTGGTTFALPPDLYSGTWSARVQALWTRDGAEQHSPFSPVLQFAVS